MTDTSGSRIPFGLAMIAGAVVIAGLASMFVFDRWLTGRSWLIYAAAAPAYLLLQIFAEGALGLFAGSWRRAGPVVAALILVGFYVAWFAQV